jgi:hypothetical protein
MNQTGSATKTGERQRESIPKPKRGLWWVVKRGLICLVLLLLALVVANFRLPPGTGTPLVRIAPETTWATSPLNADGDVDYMEFINQQYAVTPENNAMVDLVRIIGPKPDGALVPAAFFEKLGIDPPPEVGDYFFDFNPAYKKEACPSVTIEGIVLNAQEQWDLSEQVPFESGQMPAVDQWFEKYKDQIAEIQEAVKKPAYYSPYIGNPPLSAILYYAHNSRSIARALLRSSNLKLGRGNTSGAIDDAMATIRLGRHVGRQGMLVELLIGIALEGMGQGALGGIVVSDKCTADELKRIAEELDALPTPPALNKRHLDFEHALSLEIVIYAGRYGPVPWANNDLFDQDVHKRKDASLLDAAMRASIDWGTVCIETNKAYAKMERVMESGASSANQDLIAQFELELAAMSQGVGNQPVTYVKDMLLSPGTRGKLVGERMVPMLAPALRQVLDAGLRTEAICVVKRVAVAVQRYKLEHGEYPHELLSLVPEFLDAVPLDPYTQKPLVYKSDVGNPFTLYSVGPNESDDGGIDMELGTWPNIDLPAFPVIRTIPQWLKNYKQE